jgi:hypothetical protein
MLIKNIPFERLTFEGGGPNNNMIVMNKLPVVGFVKNHVMPFQCVHVKKST